MVNKIVPVNKTVIILCPSVMVMHSAIVLTL